MLLIHQSCLIHYGVNDLSIDTYTAYNIWQQFKMSVNFNQVVVNSHSNLPDIEQFSPKTIEDYSIVSRKHLERILNNSERCLTEEEHRWLIKRDCKRVILDIKRRTRRKKSRHVLPKEMTEGTDEKVSMCAIDQFTRRRKSEHVSPEVAMAEGIDEKLTSACEIDQYVQVVNNISVLYCNDITPAMNANILNFNPGSSGDVGGENRYNVVVENNLTVIHVHRLNTSVNANDTDCDDRGVLFEYGNIGRAEDKNDSQVIIMDLERIYWDKWRRYVNKKLSIKTNRCEKIDMFLLKIQEKLKANQSKNDEIHKASKRIVPKEIKTVYDRQQIKIENQKKLLDKQQKEIERLKLQQLKLESEKALLENQKMFNQTYHKSEKSLQIKNVPRKSALEKASPTDILNRMEIRALDRQAKWEAIKERRRKMELEKQRKKQELEEKCIKEQMEQKRKKLFEARENLRLKRIEECKQKMEREILQENIKIADDFHRRLMLKKGLEGFKINLYTIRLKMKQASNYYNEKYLGVCFNKWRFFVNNNLNEKIFLAEQFYKKKLMKSVFLRFFQILEERKRKEQVAEDWYNFKVQEFWFGKWLNYVSKINIETKKKILEAESYHNRVMMKYCFDNWRKFPEIVYKERLKDCRLRMWHEKVQEILPDFVPPEF